MTATGPTPETIVLRPPWIVYDLFDAWVAFLVSLGYQVVDSRPGPDGGGEVTVQAHALFCPCCAAPMTVAQLQEDSRCPACRDEACVDAAGNAPATHARFARLFYGGPLKGQVLRSDIPPLFESEGG